MAFAHTTTHHTIVPVQAKAPAIPTVGARVQLPALGFAMIEAVIGYEWLLSALPATPSTRA